MNRRRLLSMLGLAPIAAAAGINAAKAAAPNQMFRDLSVNGVGVDQVVAGEKLYDPRDVEVANLKYELAFNRHGSEWLYHARKDNVEITMRDYSRGSVFFYEPVSVRFNDFAMADDDIFVTLEGPDIRIENQSSGRLAFVPRSVLLRYET